MIRNLIFTLSLLFSLSLFAQSVRKPASEIIYIPQAVICGSSSYINEKLYEIKTKGWTLVSVSDELKSKIGPESLRFGKKEGVYDVHVTPVPEGDTKYRGICFLFKVIR